MRITTDAGLRRVLKRLGNTPDEIAASLEALGVTGRRADANACPIACYIKRAENVVDCSTYGSTTVHTTTGAELYVPNSYDNPIFKFQVRFDNREYPRLDIEQVS
jgi:hypothetical protein